MNWLPTINLENGCWCSDYGILFNLAGGMIAGAILMKLYLEIMEDRAKKAALHKPEGKEGKP